MCNDCCTETATDTGWEQGNSSFSYIFKSISNGNSSISSASGGILIPRPKMAVYKGDETHVIWSDGSKTSATWMGGEDEAYDPEDAVALCLAYKIFGTKTAFRNFVMSGKFQLTKEQKDEMKREKLTRRVESVIIKTGEGAVDKAKETDEFPF